MIPYDIHPAAGAQTKLMMAEHAAKGGDHRRELREVRQQERETRRMLAAQSRWENARSGWRGIAGAVTA